MSSDRRHGLPWAEECRRSWRWAGERPPRRANWSRGRCVPSSQLGPHPPRGCLHSKPESGNGIPRAHGGASLRAMKRRNRPPLRAVPPALRMDFPATPAPPRSRVIHRVFVFRPSAQRVTLPSPAQKHWWLRSYLENTFSSPRVTLVTQGWHKGDAIVYHLSPGISVVQRLSDTSPATDLEMTRIRVTRKLESSNDKIR